MIIAMLLLSIVIHTGKAFAFKWVSHRRITRQGMIGVDPVAMNEIISGNLSVDEGQLQHQQPCHFDNETFEKGSAFIRDQFAKAADALSLCQASQARRQLGMALHTVQDFYAHTNFVEINLQRPNATIDLFNLRNPTRKQSAQHISDR